MSLSTRGITILVYKKALSLNVSELSHEINSGKK
jgi:hypothetical protein